MRKERGRHLEQPRKHALSVPRGFYLDQQHATSRQKSGFAPPARIRYSTRDKAPRSHKQKGNTQLAKPSTTIFVPLITLYFEYQTFRSKKTPLFSVFDFSSDGFPFSVYHELPPFPFLFLLPWDDVFAFFPWRRLPVVNEEEEEVMERGRLLFFGIAPMELVE